MSSKESAEIALVAALQEDSVAAFDALYHMYFPAVYANILHLVKEEAAAQDIVQEVFIRLWEKRKLLHAGQPAGNWLFVVSYNRSLNYLRSSLRQRLKAAELAPDVAEPEQDEWQVASIQLDMLERAIDQLPPQRKKVFLLCKMQGKTYAEAARELQISHYTVKEHITKASRFIREYVRLQPEWQALVAVFPLFAKVFEQ
ncbi:RNA polymerase sigma-70 factor [Chitinophaga sp.]|uniref:RNA polymerase sigma-70 factor n=1 Tax=Chitinophaga sp. TaxID=1869181 RepID=UPI0031D6CA05